MYDHRTTPNQIIIGSTTQKQIQIGVVAADKTLPSIVLPTFNSKLMHAYLTLEITGISQGNAGDQTDGDQYIQLDNSDGSGYHNALLIPDDSFYTPQALLYSYYISIMGAIDIKTYCTSGATLTLKWTNAKSTIGTSYYYNARLYVTLIFA